jgi:OOP family OmpA-OmpF porin
MFSRYAPLALLLVLPACVSTGKAIQYASYRSDCDKVQEVSQDGHKAVLNVCGLYEDWGWHGFNGWEYVGPSAQQPDFTPMDGDADGVPDDSDACPTIAGVGTLDPATNGCPPPADADRDGVPDGVDACPQEPGVADADPLKNGCRPPMDLDGDGITDDVDACPEVRGVTSPDPKKNGCPGDTDGDGIDDPTDACPDDAGKADPDPAKNGCPTVQVKGDQIVINERIEFATGQSVIKPVSNQLLDDIAKVMKDHPELKKIEIQGHTDNQGAAALNRMLSRNRAIAVMKALETRGVEATRMTAKGFGPDKPVGANDTEEGRQANRRVQFQITEQDKAAPPPVAPPPVAPPPTAPTPTAPTPTL